MNGVLSGVRVIDFGRYIAGPYCAALLADFGADVIRVEKREGSEDRFLLPISETGDGALFFQMNRDKRSITLDPMHETGRAIVRRLLATADVVVANLPPPTLVKMGLDFPTLQAIDEKLILTAVSAFGPVGPYAERVGFDGVGQAMSGSIFMSGTPEQPYRSMTNFVDFGTALAAAYGTALALLARERTGRGQLVDVSLLRTALNFTNAGLIEEAVLGIGRKASGNRAQSSAPADLFQASDGWLLVQVVGNPLFARIARAIGSPEWLTDPRFASDIGRGEHGAEISARVAAWCAERTVVQALAELDAARIPCGPVYSPRQILDDPHVRISGMLQTVDAVDLPAGVRVANRIVGLSDEPAPPFVRAPLLGAHTDEILAELGYDEREIASFTECGAI